MLCQTEVIVFQIPSIKPPMVSLMAVHTALAVALMDSHIPAKKSRIPLKTVSQVALMASHAWVKKVFIASHTAIATSFTFSQRSIQNYRKSSLVFQR